MVIAAQLWLLFAGFAALTSVAGLTVVTGNLPADTSLEFILASGLTLTAAGGGAIQIGAAEAISGIALKLPNGAIFDVHGARVKIVQGSTTSAAAAAGACYPGGAAHVGVEMVDSPLYLSTGWQTYDASGVQELRTVTFNNEVAFRRGGVYRVCYTSDGTFRGQAVGSSINLYTDVPDVDIVVSGVTSDCTGAQCVSDRTFPCYSRLGELGAPNACGVNTYGIAGSFGRTSWSPAFVVTYGGNGMALSTVTPSCGGTPDPMAFCPGQVGCPSSIANKSVDVVNANAMYLPPSLSLQYGNESRTVAICYCSGVRGCGQYGEYPQQLGILQLFVSVVTPPTEITCISSMWGILSEMLFVVCVICPPTGCPYGVGGSRLRIVENQLDVPEHPAWSANHVCRTAPTTRHLIPSRPAANWSEPNVTDYEDSLDAGSRSDYRRFQPTTAAGFSLPTWPVFKSPGTEVDLCFCLGSCHSRASWFKVGQLDVFLTQLTSFASVTDTTEMIVPNEVGVPGQLVLDASLLPYDNARIFGLLPGGAVYVASFNPGEDASSTDACMKDVQVNVVGLTRNNMSAYIGRLRDQRLLFDGGVTGTTLTFLEAGAATVCYCPFPSSSASNGCGSGDWMGIGLLVISGPRPNQHWDLPTLHTQRIQYYGTDLRSTDRLAFISRYASCDVSTPAEDLCPPYYQFSNQEQQDGHEVCGTQDPLQVVRYANYSTQILECSDQTCTVACNEQNQNCKTGIVITTVNATANGIKFGFDQSTSSPGGLGDLGLASGDTLMMDSGVECGTKCTQAMLDTVTGYRMNAGLQAVMPLSPNADIYLNPTVLRRRLFDPSRPWSLMMRVKISQIGWKTLCVLGDTDPILGIGEVEFGLAGWTSGGLLPGSVRVRQGATANGGIGMSVNTTAAGAVRQGFWDDVAIVYTGSVSRRLSIYINGQLQYYVPKVLIKTAYQPLACGVSIRDPIYTEGLGSVFLNDVRWYNTPLSLQEVQTETNKGIMSGSVDPLGSSAPLGNVMTTGADAKTFEIKDLTWSPTPEFVVSNAGASWSRTNRAVSKAEILSSKQGTYKVCWEREGRSAEVGTVRFVNPERLQDVGIHFTASAMSVMTPFVLTFRTSAATSYAGRRYREATGPMRLELVILDTDAYDIGQSPFDGYELTMNPPGGENSLETATQAMCGVLFREMWSDDPAGGFPLPQGCYYHSLRQGGDGMRKIVILFGARNGLRGGVSYQLVMNGVAYNEYNVDRAVMMISSMDDINSRRYDVLEYNHAFGNQGFQLVAGKNDPQLAVLDGLVVQGGDTANQLYELPPDTSPQPSLSIHMKGADFTTGKIKRKCLLRFWLWPLTQWFLPDNCADKMNTWTNFRLGAFRVQCTKVIGKFRKCGFINTCQGSKVVRLGRQTPSIFIELPGTMNDLFGTITYKLDFYGLITPEAGLPPTRMGAQLTKPDDTKPDYYITKGPFIYTTISESFMLGRLLTDPDDGLPFEGSSTHLLYMLIGLPVTVKGYYDWALLGGPSIRPTSYFEVTVPDGFLCLNITALPAEGLGKLLYTPYGDAIAKLGDVSQEAPTGFGFPAIKGWTAGQGRKCRYTLLDKQMIPARSTMVVGVRVMPTNYSLSILNAANLWQLTMATAGDHNLSIGTQTYTTGFYRTGKAGVPVVGELTQAFVQPSNQALSTAEAITVQTLSVFFYADYNTSLGGSVELEAPEHFNFDSCVAQNLPETYYTSGPSVVSFPLPEIEDCVAITKRTTQVSRPKFAARVYIVGRIQTFRRYAFQITVANPTLTNLTEFHYGNWILRTRDMYEVVVSSTKDRTPSAIAGALPQYTPFVVRNASLMAFNSLADALVSGPGVVVMLVSTLPHFVSAAFTNASVLFRLPYDFHGVLRIAAPDGYVWCHDCALSIYVVASMNGFDIVANGSSIAVVSNSPANSITRNILNSSAATFLAGVLYGLRAPISVPRFSTTTSAHSFFFEFAPHPMPSLGDAGLGLAGVVPAEPVQTIFDAKVRSLDHLPGVQADMLFHMRLSTPVPSPGGLRILFPPGHGVHNSCEALPWPGQQAWPSDSGLATATCQFYNDTLMLRAGSNPLPSGVLRFRVSVTNPEETVNRNWTLWMDTFPSLWKQTCGDPPCWLFESNSNCTDASVCTQQTNSSGWNYTICNATPICTGQILDAPQSIQGTPLGIIMAHAGISGFRPPERDDHPGRANRLVFYFQLADPDKESSVVMPGGELILAGPAGFKFQTRCLPVVETRTDMIFGSLAVAKNYFDVDAWEDEAAVWNCEGSGQLVTLQVASGLYTTRKYAFAIHLTNPWVTVAANKWTLSFEGYFATPFPTFDLWTFSNVVLTPFSQHAGAMCFNDGTCRGAGQGVAVPMKLRFQVLNTVTTGGELHITTPEGFGFSPITPWPTDGEILRTDSPTACIMRQYEGGNYSSTPTQWREKDRDCMIVNKGSPIDGTGTGDHRTFRLILRFVYNEVDPTPAKRLHISSGYEIIVFVDPPTGYRPATEWVLETFGVTKASLDIGDAAGFEVAPVFTEMRHSNDGINILQNTLQPINVEGLSTLVDFIIDIKLPDIARNGDTIVFIAPPTFRMHSNGSCVKTLILAPARAATPPNQTETVTCYEATLRVHLSGLVSAIQSGSRVRFRIFLSNPEAPSPLDQNFWRAEHRSSAGGGLKSAAMINSWHVIPRLANPSMRLVGTLKGAGSLTTLRLAFRTVQAAVEILIESKGAGIFDFKSAFATAIIGDRTSVPQLLGNKENSIYLGTAMEGFTQVSVTLLTTVLPTVSGFSNWRVTTYKLAEKYLDPSILNDEVLFEGFFVPGLVTVPATTAVTGVISAALLGKKTSVVTFQVVISTDIAVGDELHVRVEGAGFVGFELAPRKSNGGYGRAPDALLHDGTGQKVGAVSASSTGEDVSSLHSCIGAPPGQSGNSSEPIRKILLKVDRSMTAGVRLAMRITLTTPPDRGILKQERWRFEVWRKGAKNLDGVCEAILVATNDAGLVPLPVVTQLPSVAPIVPHRPPLTVIPVEVILDPLDTGAQAFVVTAPAGFSFPSSCTAAGGPSISCQALPANSAGLSRAKFMCTSGGTACMRQVSTFFLTLTPRSVTPNSIWFVEAVFLNAAGDVEEQLGRAELPGFGLIDMSVEISYAALAGVPVQIAVWFESRVNLTVGSYVHVLAARALGRFGCGNKVTGFLNPLSLGSLESCTDTRNPLSVTIKLNGSLTAGIHTFTVPAETPLSSSNPADNIFEVYLRDPAGHNKDVALRLPGETMALGLRMIAWPLWWRQIPSYETSVDVTVPLEILDDANILVSQILIALPLGPPMLHLGNVQVSSGKGRNLPLRSVVVPNDNTVLLKLEPTVFLRSGLYSVRFAVRVPKQRPQVDIWRVAICKTPPGNVPNITLDLYGCSLTGIQRSGRGASVIAVFTLSGFDAYSAPGGSELLPMLKTSSFSWQVQPLWLLALLLVMVQCSSLTAR